jgi:hypothetical protein
MLISMPTGTSTILGAFQAIRLSFLNRTTFALTDKVTRIAKFASGIFVAKNLCLFHVATRKDLVGRRPRLAQNGVRSSVSQLPESDEMVISKPRGGPPNQ